MAGRGASGVLRMIRGSVVVHRRRCGKPTCRCAGGGGPARVDGAELLRAGPDPVRDAARRPGGRGAGRSSTTGPRRPSSKRRARPGGRRCSPRWPLRRAGRPGARVTKGGHECAGGRLKRANPAASQMCGVASPQGSATSEHHGPSLRVGLLPSVGDAVNLQPGRVERGQQITLVAELNGGGL